MTARAVTAREIVWATSLSAILVLGVLAVLLLQTAMQNQARLLDAQQSQAAALTQKAQFINRDLAIAANPRTLAVHARALDMHPQLDPKFAHSRRQHRAFHQR